jgi:hypothetical protein
MKKRIIPSSFFICTVMVSFLYSCTERKVSQFVADGNKHYVEIVSGKKVQKIVTEMNERYQAVVIFDEYNVPQWLKVSFTDSAKQQTGFVWEFRKEKNGTSDAADLIDRNKIDALENDNAQFAAWRKQYLDYITVNSSTGMGRYVFVDSSNGKPSGIDLVNGTAVRFNIKNYFCSCKRGYALAHCMISATRCALDNLCKVWDCVEAGEWSPECSQSLDQAKVCLGEYRG